MILRFQSNGKIKSIHSDSLMQQIQQIFPGAKASCPRASNVHFDSRIQKWRVKPKNHPILKQSFKNRKEAIDFEISWLNEHVIGA